MTTEPTNQHRILYHLGDRCEVIAQIGEALNLSNAQVGKAACGLIASGYIERVERGCFQLTEAGAQAVANGVRICGGGSGPTKSIRKPSRNTIRQRAWRAMQIHREFTVPDIAMVVSRADPPKAYKSLHGFLRQLVAAGYVMRTARKVPGTASGSNGFNRFRLIRDTGPRAPVYSHKRGSFHDFNTGKDWPCKQV